MGAELPLFSELEFRQRLTGAGHPLEPRIATALYTHLLELRRWQRTVSLIGPGTLDELVERHYGESLVARHYLGGESGQLLDVGSGAGFPGFVLAAACPTLAVTLTESRQRKCAFLIEAARRAAVPCQVVATRVAVPLPAALPETIDFLTLRGVKLSQRVWRALVERLTGRVLWWCGAEPLLPAGLEIVDRRQLAGAGDSSLLVLRRRGR